MMTKIETGEFSGKDVAEEAFYLAWKACGDPISMGIFQDYPMATKEEVIANARSNGDYPADHRQVSTNELYGDYVFGRMMKLSLNYGEDFVEVPDYGPRSDYQSWAFIYDSYTQLIANAIASLRKEYDKPK
jgi:hypothetical protein